MHQFLFCGRVSCRRCANVALQVEECSSCSKQAAATFRLENGGNTRIRTSLFDLKCNITARQVAIFIPISFLVMT